MSAPEFWTALAWQWPFVVATIARGLTALLIVALTAVVTRWWVRRNLVPMLPEIARDKLARARREEDHYRRLYEAEAERSRRYRTIIRGSIATASHTLMNLQSIDAEDAESSRAAKYARAAESEPTEEESFG